MDTRLLYEFLDHFLDCCLGLLNTNKIYEFVVILYLITSKCYDDLTLLLTSDMAVSFSYSHLLK